jgi:hypothetical protein
MNISKEFIIDNIGSEIKIITNNTYQKAPVVGVIHGLCTYDMATRIDDVLKFHEEVIKSQAPEDQFTFSELENADFILIKNGATINAYALNWVVDYELLTAVANVVVQFNKINFAQLQGILTHFQTEKMFVKVLTDKKDLPKEQFE